jgi:hypothetical protein
METTISELSDAYDEQRHEGQRRIQRCWQYLAPATRAVLTGSGFYSERGQVLDGAERMAREPEDDIERLEYALGALAKCAAAKLPYPGDKEAPWPKDALHGDIPGRCEELLLCPAWRDPQFLRLGLRAVATHETAKALQLATPAKAKSIALGCFVGVVSFVLVLLLPAALGGALVSAAQGELGATVIALYCAAVCLWPVWWSKQKEAGRDTTDADRRYLAWAHFQAHSGETIIGAGAQHRLSELVRKGVQVPDLVYDLCAALQQATQRGN